MSNSSLLVRSAVIYAICLPLAIVLGYFVATPGDFIALGPINVPVGAVVIMVIFAVLLVPIVLRWHYPWLVATWNLSAVVFFLPGRPSFGFVMCAISILISLLQHTLNKNFKFIHVPSVAWPLCFLTLVVLATAELTGGIGLAMTGSSSIGGKRYLTIIAAVVGYFALTARRIPRERAGWYIVLYFMATLASLATNLAGLLGPSMSFIYLVFPIDSTGFEALTSDMAFTSVAGEGILRLGGLAAAAASISILMLAIYGVKGMFTLRKFWRLPLFISVSTISLYGGYRSTLIGLLLTFALVYWWEGSMRSRMTPIFALFAVLGVAFIIAFATLLPLSIQRTLTFVPGLKLDPVAEMSAKASSEWRLDMWKYVIPEIPRHLLLGKGLSIDAGRLQALQDKMTAGTETAEGSALAGDYHNGPLTILVTFGIFGAFGFLWFLWGSIKVLYRNYLHGDPALKRINTFLLAHFVAKVLFYFLIYGSFHSDLAVFTGLIGLSIAINGGVQVPAPAARPAPRRLQLPRGATFAGAPGRAHG